MSILVLGTLALDTVRTPVGLREAILGGSAAHFAMSARLFTQVNLVAVVGKDFPRKHLLFLREKGAVLNSVITGEGESFKWSGEYRGDLNAAVTLDTRLGVLAEFRPQITEEQRWIKSLFLANIDPDIQLYVLKKMHSLRLAGLDSMNYWIESKRKSLLKALKEIDIYLVNENEARQLSGEHNLIKAASAIRKLGPKMVVLKKGEHGVLFYCDKFIFSLPAYPLQNIVDPTGAGDTFAGGFMGYLDRQKTLKDADIKKAIAYGVACSSFNVEGFGMEKTARLELKDVDNRLEAFKKVISL